MTKAYKALPSAEELWELFDYKPLTGELVWNNHPRYKAWKGKTAGSVYENGYKVIELKIKGKRLRYTIQRVIWKWVTSKDPGAFHVDHRDRCKMNNTFGNYRLSTPKQNSNNRLCRHWVLTPFGRYRVMMGPSGTHRYKGTFRTQAEAEEVIRKISLELHGAFSCYS